MKPNILQYVPKVWATADLLIGAGIKQSDFPKFMMPFFGLLMVESRLVRETKKLLKDFNKETVNDFSKKELNDFTEEFEDLNLGYNEYVIKHNKTLKTICENDKTFIVDFDAYLSSYDLETRGLLGVGAGNEDEKFLNVTGIAGQLKKKKILFAFAKAWGEINLEPFNNSEITTLEEHIKRKWADISAETAGEQYTPDDIIALISEIITSKIEDNNKFLTIYDPTCGGGNMLFGTEERINKIFPNRLTATYGEDWNDTLYALAKIESRFRKDSHIEYGNSLTGLKFSDKSFDIIVANPPYGVDWKGYKKDIINDQTDRFKSLPSISDGQFLFAQHILSQLDDNGLAVVVHNGSTLFSGDAGSGESNIRKYLFDNDWVEAVIQMPTNEFFNTPIYTYLWVFNKNKPIERKDKVMLLDASNLYEQLEKSKGKKRKQMNLENRIEIIKAFTEYKDNDFTKVFDKWDFYFNKQSIMLTNVDDDGNAIEMPVKKNREGELVEQKNIKIDTNSVMLLDSFNEEDMKVISQMKITDYPTDEYSSLKDYYDKYYKNYVAQFDYKAHGFAVIDTDDNTFTYNTTKESIVKADTKQVETKLGNGKIIVKASFKKATKTRAALIDISVTLTKDLQKDYEIIDYVSVETDNQQNIANFMAKYISKPFEYLDNVIGVELNFNKVFYKPEILRPVTTITTDLEILEDDLQGLEKELSL